MEVPGRACPGLAQTRQRAARLRAGRLAGRLYVGRPAAPALPRPAGVTESQACRTRTDCAAWQLPKACSQHDSGKPKQVRKALAVHWYLFNGILIPSAAALTVG